MSKQKDNGQINKDSDITKALEVLFASEYLNKRKLYLNNLVRGIFFGVGSVLGATVVVVVLLWVMSLFEEIPLIGPVADKFTDSIQNR